MDNLNFAKAFKVKRKMKFYDGMTRITPILLYKHIEKFEEKEKEEDESRQKKRLNFLADLKNSSILPSDKSKNKGDIENSNQGIYL
jgi:hypothetical protein